MSEEIEVTTAENPYHSNFTLENPNYDQILKDAIFTIEDYFNITGQPLKLVKKTVDKPNEEVSYLISAIDYESLKGTCIRESDKAEGKLSLSIMDLANFSHLIKTNLLKKRGTLTPINKEVLDKTLDNFKAKTSVPLTTGGTKKYRKDVLKEYILAHPEGIYQDAEDNLSQEFGGEKIVQFSSFMYEARKSFE